MSVEQSLARMQQFGDRPFRVAEATDAGIPRYELYRLRDRGEVVGVGPGLFRRAGSPLSSSTDLATVCAWIPDGTICLNSALAYWDLTDELPAVVHIALARGSHRPRIDQPATAVHVFAAATFDLERREETTETGELLRIYSPERAVVDAMRLAHHIGRDTALHALSRYLRRPDAQPRRLAALARDLGGRRRLTNALEVMLSDALSFAVLSDPGLMGQIREGEEALAAGDPGSTLAEVQADLDGRRRSEPKRGDGTRTGGPGLEPG